MVTFGISVDEPTVAQLDAIAQEMQTNRSTVIRWAIKNYLTRKANEDSPTDKKDGKDEVRSQ